MKALAPVFALALLAACDRGPAAPPDSESNAQVPGKTAQASIMRPEIAVETAAPALEALNVTVSFPEGGSELAAAEISKLEALIASPQVKRGGPIRLGAHSDAGGSDTANLAAARKRGEAVRDWLLDQGIEEDRVTLVVFGEQNPIHPNALPDGSPNKAGRAANRRVEIEVPVPEAPSAEPRVPTLAEEIVQSSGKADLNQNDSD